MSDEQWGPWIEHGRKPQRPVCLGTYGQIEDERFGFLEGVLNNPDEKAWRHVIRYRVKRPKGLTILENLIAEIPEEVAG